MKIVRKLVSVEKYEVIDLKDAVLKFFSSESWEELLYLVKEADFIKEDHRIYDGLVNPSGDYSDIVLDVLMKLVANDRDNLIIINKYLERRCCSAEKNSKIIDPVAHNNGESDQINYALDRRYFEDLCFKNKDELTEIICPFCSSGKLKISSESLQMEYGYYAEDINAEDLKFVYSALLMCANEKCNRYVSMGGEAFTEQIPSERWNIVETFEYFYPKWFTPSINLFSIPDDCPDEISKNLKQSFASFFNDPVASGMHLRISLERLMDFFNVPTEVESSKGRMVQLSLHKRIETYKLDEEQIGGHLLALKWLGNDASHVGSLERSDILDGYEIFEFVINELFYNRKRREAVGLRSQEMHRKFAPKR